MLLDTPLITTLLAALVVLAITYTLTTLIDRRIAEIRADRANGKADEIEDGQFGSQAF